MLHSFQMSQTSVTFSAKKTNKNKQNKNKNEKKQRTNTLNAIILILILFQNINAWSFSNKLIYLFFLKPILIIIKQPINPT